MKLASFLVVPIAAALLIFVGFASTFSQDDLPTSKTDVANVPAYIEGEALVVFKSNPSEPADAEVNSLGLNFANSTDRADVTKAVMEKRLKARDKAFKIEPVILFDTGALRNEHVRERMENLGEASANTLAEGAADHQLVLGVVTSTQQTTTELVTELTKNPEVAYVQPNYLYTADELSADESSNFPNAVNQENAQTLYGVFDNENHAGVRADTIWSQGITGKNVIVADIDSGVDIYHQDLKDNIWKNSGETNCTNGVDDDLNGYIDDCYGWDFGDNDSDATNNDFAHGTHTAGTIAAKRDNSGVVGVAPDAKIMPLKVFRANRSASSLAIAQAIDYAWQNGAQIINMSLGAPAVGCPQIEHDVIQKAYAAGVFIIASSGNDGPNSPQSPAICQYVMTVGATDTSKKVTSYSGSYQDMVDGVAPGHKIISSYPQNKYAEQSGTSMAAPHVAGIAALMFEKNPTLAPLKVAEIFCSTAEDIAPAGFDERSGCGFISAQKALAAVPAGVTERDCHLITDDETMPDTTIFGVPYNVNSPARENLMSVRCGASSVKATIGGAQQKTYIYSKGYTYVNNDWVQLTLDGPKKVFNDVWREDTATSNLTALSSRGKIGYLLSFICMDVNGEMKCGCREDGVCQGNVWNLQAYQP